MALNAKMIAALGVDLPEVAEEESTFPVPAPIDPSDIVLVDNPNLPEMEDIETNMVEGERQLETLIQNGFEMFRQMSEENSSIQPNYRNSHLEKLIMIFQATADVVKYKTELQLKKKKARLDDAKFPGRPTGSQTETIAGPGQVTNIFMSQKDIVKAIQDARQAEQDKRTAENFSDAPEPK